MLASDQNTVKRRRVLDGALISMAKLAAGERAAGPRYKTGPT
jgi:hypothetical protein